VKIGLLNTNVAAIKRKEDLAFLNANASLMCTEVKACHKAQCELIMADMRAPLVSSMSSNPTPPADPPKPTNRKKKRRRCSSF
jgi:hypothetical protein